MRNRMRVLYFALAFVLAWTARTAGAQDARSLLQAADQAMGASKVQSIQISGSGLVRPVGQSFASDADWPQLEMPSYTQTIDYGSRSSKEELVRRQGKYPERGGGGIPIQGEQRQISLVSGNYAWKIGRAHV